MDEKGEFKTILGPGGRPASIIFNSATVRNPGTEKEMVINTVPSGINSFGFNTFGSPGNSNFPGQAMLSNVDTFAKNLRFYFVSNFRQIVSQSYIEYGLVRTIVDVPVEDGYRGGFKFKTDQLDEDNVKKLMKVMKKKRDLKTAARAQKWGRLFGGAAILCLVDDQDPETPLEMDSINENSNVEFRAVDLWELSPNQMNVGQIDPASQSLNYDWFIYYGEKIHKSRVKKIMGLEVPSFDRPRLRGWGASVLETLIRSINQYLKGTDLAYEVLDEFKLDVFKISGWLQALATPESETLALKRIQYANGRKNYQHATILDKDDDFVQRQLSFAGLAETMTGVRLQVASDLRMPLTKIFGISAQGFNAGQEDLENYNMMVESTIREDGEELIIWMAEIRSHELFGTVPDDLEGEFKPLRVMSGIDEQTVKTGKATILDSARGRGDISMLEYREAVNSGALMDAKLDNSDQQLSELEASAEEKQQAELDAQAEAGPAGSEKGGKGKTAAKSAPEAKEPKKEGKPVSNKLTLLRRILNAISETPEIVTVGILNGDQILTGRRRDNDKWVSPGGHMDEGETPDQAAIREVMEESGIEITQADLKKISTQTIVSHRTGKEFILHCFVANIEKEKATAKNDPDEEIAEWKWVALDRATAELKPESRHAKDDAILNYLFK